MAARDARQVASDARQHDRPFNLDDYRDEIGRIKVSEISREDRDKIRTPAFLIGKVLGYLLGYGLTAAGLIGLLMWTAVLLHW